MNDSTESRSIEEWQAVSASVRGSSHDRSGKPNQDSVRVLRVAEPLTGLVAAVCDGHGGDRYIRSDIGSRLGVEVACEAGRSALVELGAEPSAAQIEAQLAGATVKAIVTRWRNRVLEHLAAHPFTEDEHERFGSALEAQPLVSYGCTMVMAVFGANWIGFLQIGDGDVTTVADDHVGSPVPGDERLVANETTSLCLPTAETDARVAASSGQLPELVMLTSDGYANSFASPTWRDDTGQDMARQIRERGLASVEKRLPSWLNDSAVAGGDDVSMALVYRGSPAGQGTAALTVDGERTTASETVSGDVEHTDEVAAGPVVRPSRRRTWRDRRAVLLALLLVVAAVGVGIGWAAGSSSNSSAGSDAGATALPRNEVGVTTTSRAVPPTPTSAPAPIGPSDEIGLFVGERSAVLSFDPTDPSNSNPRMIREAQPGFGRGPELPNGWRLEGRTLIREDRNSGPQRIDALAVTSTGDLDRPSDVRVWVLTPDGLSLMAYDDLGKTLGMSQLDNPVLTDTIAQGEPEQQERG